MEKKSNIPSFRVQSGLSTITDPLGLTIFLLFIFGYSSGLTFHKQLRNLSISRNMTHPSCHRRPNLLSEFTKALKWLKMTLALSSDLCVSCRIHGNMTSGSLYQRLLFAQNFTQLWIWSVFARIRYIFWENIKENLFHLLLKTTRACAAIKRIFCDRPLCAKMVEQWKRMRNIRIIP